MPLLLLPTLNNSYLFRVRTQDVRSTNHDAEFCAARCSHSTDTANRAILRRLVFAGQGRAGKEDRARLNWTNCDYTRSGR